jgi:DNA-binding PadR family transcriptional regulator
MARHLPHFFGSHRGGGLGRFGRGFKDGDGMGGRAFGMGRKLKSIDLQLLILGLLAHKARHGYEIIKALDERSQGYYVPSPGMVYPALTHLEELGRATVEADGTRKLYHITEAGREYLDEHRALADALLAQIGRVAQRMERVRRALNAEEDALNDQGRYSKDLLRARRELQSALADTWASSAEEQRRIAAILERAAADIRGEHSRA